MLEDDIYGVFEGSGGMEKAKEGTRAVVRQITELQAEKRLPGWFHFGRWIDIRHCVLAMR